MTGNLDRSLLDGAIAVVAAVRVGWELTLGSTVVTILPDTGERYLSTFLFESL